MGARDKSGSPMPADVGYLHDLEYRLSSSWISDELGDIGQGFGGEGGELACGVELAPGDHDTPEGIFKEGMKGL